MKRILTLSALIIVTMYLNAQSCLPEGIEFNTQEEIDNFQSNYPGCNSIEGDVFIQGEDIYSLAGLSDLISIGGYLFINDNSALTNLTGLNNLIFIGGGLFIEGNQSLSSVTGLENLLIIGGGVIIYFNPCLHDLQGLNNLHFIQGSVGIEGNDSLTTLSGLDNLTTIGGELIIGCETGWPYHYNPSLMSLTGLENLNSVAGGVRILGNPVLTDLSGLNYLKSTPFLSISYNQELVNLNGLDSLTTINGIYIHDNPNLQSLTGLENIEPNSITSLTICNNDSLYSCEVGAICEFLSAPSGSVNIYNNAIGCNNPAEIASACGFQLPCLPYGNYYLTCQSEIDDFQSNYSNCYNLEGNVTIAGNDIINLQGLKNITGIEGDLRIGYPYGNPRLANLTGLENLEFVISDLRIRDNDSLTNLTGLENLSHLGNLYISYNDALTGLSGLESITTTDRISIHHNKSLTSLTGLENLNGTNSSVDISNNDLLSSLEALAGVYIIGDKLSIINNDTLTTLYGLENLNILKGNLYITENNNLVDLSGIKNISAGTIEDLSIKDNALLQVCHIESICEYLASPNGETIIENNAPGCNSVEEVQDACEFVSIEEYTTSDEHHFFPNPSSGLVNLTYSLIEDSRITIDIFNLSGIKVLHVLEKQERKGEHQRLVDLGSLPPGMYLVVMQTGKGKVVEKIIKY